MSYNNSYVTKEFPDEDLRHDRPTQACRLTLVSRGVRPTRRAGASVAGSRVKAKVSRDTFDPSEILLAVEAFDKIRPRGGDHKSEKSKASREAFDPDGKSAVETAKILGVGRASRN